MRPHLAHLQNTMIKKQLAVDALDTDKPMKRFRDLVARARAAGYDGVAIITELQAERFRIKTDIRCGDSLFLKGIENAQSACIVAIDKIISEIKGEI